MNYDIICFSKKGSCAAEKINSALSEGKDKSLNIYCRYEGEIRDPFIKVADLFEWTKERFEKRKGIIFVGACGIAVRAISPFVKDKLSDPPVLVTDDNATYVIPILSGHVGNANSDAVKLSELIGAVPVLTTSTDVNEAFSADLFAIENNLKIVNRDGIKKVSAKAIEGKSITISVKDYPPEGDVDILVSDEKIGESVTGFSLLLSPKKYFVGVGMKKDTPFDAFEDHILKVLSDNDIDISDVAGLCTIDIKENEPALKEFSLKYRIPVISFTSGMLNKAKGDFSHSDFVEKTVGTDNVCERAAVAGSGYKGNIVVKKTAGCGITAAVAKI